MHWSFWAGAQSCAPRWAQRHPVLGIAPGTALGVPAPALALWPRLAWYFWLVICVPTSIPLSQQPYPGWLWYHPTMFSSRPDSCGGQPGEQTLSGQDCEPRLAQERLQPQLQSATWARSRRPRQPLRASKASGYSCPPACPPWPTSVASHPLFPAYLVHLICSASCQCMPTVRVLCVALPTPPTSARPPCWPLPTRTPC